jgi:putative salt-induced outer membrane protein YdiY
MFIAILVYFMAIWFVCSHLVYVQPFLYIFPILVCITKKNLSTLINNPSSYAMAYKGEKTNGASAYIGNAKVSMTIEASHYLPML